MKLELASADSGTLRRRLLRIAFQSDAGYFNDSVEFTDFEKDANRFNVHLTEAFMNGSGILMWSFGKS